MTRAPSVSDFALHRLAFRNLSLVLNRPPAATVAAGCRGCLTALVDSFLNPPRDDVLRTPTWR